MTNNTVIYNTVDYTGMCPKDVFDKKTLPLGVHVAIDLSRTQLKDLFKMYDDDHREWTNFFGYALQHMLHQKLLEWVTSDVRIVLDTPTETTIPKKYYKDAGVEEPIEHKPLIYWHTT